MAKVVVITNQKGGVGKTTITMNIAAYIAQNHKVLVIDGDPQNSSMSWADDASDDKPFPAHMCSLAGASKPHLEIKKYMANYDYIFVDCPPSVASTFNDSVLLIADMVIVPVIPSPTDIKALPAVEYLIERIQEINENLKPFIVINMCQTNVKISDTAIEALEDFSIKKFKTRIYNRTIYRQAALNGNSVIDGKDEKAILEIKSLSKEILNNL